MHEVRRMKKTASEAAHVGISSDFKQYPLVFEVDQMVNQIEIIEPERSYQELKSPCSFADALRKLSMNIHKKRTFLKPPNSVRSLSGYAKRFQRMFC